MNNSLESFPLPSTSFKVAKLQDIYDSCSKMQQQQEKDNDNEPLTLKQLKKVYKPVTDYVYQYYYETQKGNYLFYNFNSNKFEQKDKRDFINEVMVKINEKLFKKLFEKNDAIFSIVSKLNTPRIYKQNDDYYINECHGFMHKTVKPYDEYSKDLRDRVQIILDMIKEISCGNNQEFYDAYIKYLSQLCRGMKTEVIIYKNSMQGCGKSTESDFLMNHVLGKGICMIGNTEPLVSNFNMCLLGQLLVVFEELPTFSEAQWSGASSKLKTMTTEKTMSYRGLYKEPITAENISNFIINTNVDSIKDSYGRRIIMMPVNNSRMGDYAYFNNIKTKCFNDEVGEAFYAYMMSVDVEGFYAQQHFPETDSKRVAIAEYLQSHMKFLKFKYVLKNKGIAHVAPSDLHEEYSNYCQLHNIKHILGKNKFLEKLKQDMNIVPKKTHGYYKFNVPLETLKDIAERFKWVCKYDVIEEEEEDSSDEDNSDIGYKQKYENALLRIQELENELKQYKNL